MISFIIIGKDIEKTIKLCIESVIHFIKINRIIDYEIIYIDSDSKDKTIDFVKKYSVKIYKIIGDVNSAVGRNIGAKKAQGEFLFFIDGDMELLSGFYNNVFNGEFNVPYYQFISGHHRHLHYDGNFNYLYTIDEVVPDKSHYSDVTGGLMIVKKELWEKLGGMDEKLIRNQDVDFGLRMSKLGFPVLVINHYFVNHHTISYYESNRIKYFFTSKALFSPGILMRKHIFNKTYLRIYHRNIIYVLLLLIMFPMVIIKALCSLCLFSTYILVQLFRTLKGIKKDKFIFQSFIYKVLFSFYTLLGLLFYYPNKPLYTVQEIHNK